MIQRQRSSHALILLLAAVILFAGVFHDAFFREAPNLEARFPSWKPSFQVREPELTAHAYVVRFLGEVQPILKRREWKALPPASITKLMTAFVAFDYLFQTDFLTFNAEAKLTEEKQSAAGIGESFSRDDMIKFLLMESANDAASMLASEAGKRIAPVHQTFTDALGAFTMEMNRRAGEMGMRSSHFENPAGLDAAGHRMSAEDISILFEHAYLERPELLSISRSRESTIASREGKTYMVRNTNELLKEFPGIMGSKTGFTDNAKGALAMVYAVAPKKTALIVILGSEDRFNDGRKIINWLEENFDQ